MEDKSRCYQAGYAASNIRCQVNAALEAKDDHALRQALYQVYQSGKKAASMLPEAKKVANTIAHRGSALLRIATDLHGKSDKHSKFFSDQLHPLRVYAQELETQAMKSCLDYSYPPYVLKKLPPIPAAIKKAAKAEDRKYEAAIWKRHQNYLKKIRPR